jgi:thiamine-phosphate pyrophosphorylase
MNTQIYLVAPPDADAKALSDALARALTNPDIAALLLPRGTRSDNAYKDLVKAVAPAAQAGGAAVLIEGDPGLVRTLGVDGLHVTGDVTEVREAVSALKPGHIVGVGTIHSRHDAMTKGELDIDYILFGPLSGHIGAADRELARWWAETMEIPSVLSDPDGTAASFDAEGCEFIGLGVGAWESAQ